MKKNILAAASIILSGTAFAQTGNVGIGTGTPGSKLTINGSFAATYNIITATSYTLLATDYYLAYNGASNGTVTLPTAISGTGNFQGRVYNIKNTTTASTLTIQAAGTELLDNQSGAGVANIVLPTGYFATLISKGTTGAVTTWEVAFIGNSTGTSVSADNGLTVGYNSAGKVGLGGTLAKATDIATGNNNLTFSGLGNVGIGQATAPGAKLEITTSTGDPLKLNGLQNIGAAAFNSLVVTSTGVLKIASSATQTYANTETASQALTTSTFNSGTPQVLTFTAAGGVINSGGIVTFNSANSSFTIVSAGTYSIEGFANFTAGTGGLSGTNALIGVNLAFTKNGTVIGNVFSGTRYNFTTDQATLANNGMFTRTTVTLAAGDVLYLVMYRGALDNVAGNTLSVTAPIGLGESKRVNITKL